MTKRLDQIIELVEMLTGLRGTLAGGCVRDALMSQEPKDYDLLVDNWLGVEIEHLLQMVEERGGVIHKALGSSSFLQEPPQDDGNNFLTRFAGGISFTFLDHHIEILFCQHSIEETIKLFDCNLNRVYYTPETGIVGSLPETLEFKSWVTSERRDYITEKFTKYLRGQHNA